MEMLIIRDANGIVINIGEWDYMTEEIIDADGDSSFIYHNLLPENTTSSTEEVVILPDGGLAAALE